MKNGRIVWITGASSGIGEALALAFARSGARLILSARRRSELKRVAGATGLSSDDVLILPLDLSRPADFSKAVTRIRRRFGHLDLLLNNGGISQRALARETEPKVLRRIFEVNLFGTVELTRQALPLFSRGSRVVVISSVTGRVGTPMRSAYASSKHALHGYFDSLRAELFDDGIGVTLVLPGYVRTDVSRNALTAAGRPQNQTDEGVRGGMDPAVFADRLLQAIENEKDEVVIAGPREYLAVLLSRFAPGILRKVIRTAKVT